VCAGDHCPLGSAFAPPEIPCPHAGTGRLSKWRSRGSCPVRRSHAASVRGFAAIKTDKKPFLVIISIAKKKKKIKKTKKVFAANGHFLRFREFSAIDVVKTDGQRGL
jgi:hypothetical protein